MKTIGEFLSRTKSQGPTERPKYKSEFTSYEAADLDVKFLLALAKENPQFDHVVCVPDFITCAGGQPLTVTHMSKKDGSCNKALDVRAGIIVTDMLGNDPKLWAPENIATYLDNCKSKNIKFSVCNFGLYTGTDLMEGHANALVFKHGVNVIERFEPSGRHEGHKKLDDNLKKLFQNVLPKWKYQGTQYNAPSKGPQELADAFDGLCVTYSLFYILMRLLNPESSSKDIQQWMVKRSSNEIRDDALRLNRFVIDKLKRHRRRTLARSKSKCIACGKLKKEKVDSYNRLIGKKRSPKRMRASPPKRRNMHMYQVCF